MVYKKDFTEFDNNPVAYFCAEYALSSTLPIYAGGLGVLSGDHIREAASEKFPLIPIGLLYQNAQSMLTATSANQASKENLSEMSDVNNGKLRVSVLIGERRVFAKVWRWENEGVKAYLLDTNIEENDERDREITKDLYTDVRELRLKQEILLGIGGHGFLKALNIHPSVYHLNEGHSAFVSLAVIKDKMEDTVLDFGSAHELAKKQIMFTNHTLILEGQEMFSREMIEANLGAYANEIGIGIEEIWKLGATKDNSMFSMTNLAFHVSSESNAVSKIHEEKAKILWPENHPTETVTNGVYLPRWDSTSLQGELLGASLWNIHQINKQKLLDLIVERTGERWDKDILLFGWARRFVEYKQPLLILQDIQKIKEMMTEKGRGFRIVFAGPTGSDPNSNPLIYKLQKTIEESFKGLVVFLPNYNTELSSYLTSGSDVWLNTPVIGREACGTSGMKAALNGGLPLSTRDGWIAEADLTDIGWVLDEPDVNQKLLDVIKNEIVPMYYLASPKSDRGGRENSEWVTRMQNARSLIQEQFSATRMLNEYIEKLYLPILRKNK